MEAIFRAWDEFKQEPLSPQKLDLQQQFHVLIDRLLHRRAPTLNRSDFIHYNKEAFRQWKKRAGS